MKVRIHKTQIMIMAFAILIAVAGYVTFEKKENWDKKEHVKANVDLAQDTSSEDSELNPGEVIMTGSIVQNTDYAADMKMSRQTMRSKNQESLLEIVNNTNISEEQKQVAITEMVKMTQMAEKENNAEIMLEAKGFTNVVVSLSEEFCDVVCEMGEVTDEKRAQIEDIIKRQTGMPAEAIVITAIDTSAE